MCLCVSKRFDSGAFTSFPSGLGSAGTTKFQNYTTMFYVIASLLYESCCVARCSSVVNLQVSKVDERVEGHVGVRGQRYIYS